MSILIFVVILAVLILAHEFGHFIVAKAFRIRVDEFGIGFPPKIWGKKCGETEYTVNALPIGGFVKIHGEDPGQESLLDFDKKRSFTHKPRYVQALVLLAGVFFNLLLAWFLLAGGLMSGLPSSQDEAKLRGATLIQPVLTVTSVLENSPASKMGIQAGDKIIAAGVKKSKDAVFSPNIEQFQTFIEGHADDPVKIVLRRGNEVPTPTVVPVKGIVGTDKAGIGISLDMVGTMQLPWHKAIYEGGILTLSYTQMTFEGLWGLLHDAVIGRADLSAVSGPVGIVKIVNDASVLGFAYLLILTALISINLAVVNILPIPALDGGRLLFVIIEAIRRKPMNAKAVNLANTIGFVILIGLIALVTFHDIWKIFVH